MLQQHRCQRQSHCSKFTGVHMKLMKQLSLSLVGFLMAVECFSVILCAEEPIEYPVFVQVQSPKYHYNLVGYDVLGHETVKDFLYSLKAHLNSDKEEDADEQVYYPGTGAKVEIDLEKSRMFVENVKGELVELSLHTEATDNKKLSDLINKSPVKPLAAKEERRRKKPNRRDHGWYGALTMIVVTDKFGADPHYKLKQGDTVHNIADGND